MKPESKQWHPLGDAATPAEAEALLAIKALLPDDPVTHAWPNVSFVDLNGRTAEVDLVLLTRVGFFVVELKGWHGTIDGDQQTWRLTSPGGRVRYERNPLFATDLKAKRLRSLLESTVPSAQKKQVPYVGALVVLHGRRSRVQLPEAARAHVVARDGFDVKGLPQTLSQFLATPPENDYRLIDAAKAKQVVAVVQRAGFTGTPKQRFVGQYSLEKADPLLVGPSWQDLLAAHPSLKGVKRRVRVFDVPPGSSAEARQQVELAARREYLFTQGVQHPGIAAPLDLVTTDSGTALIFAYDDAEIPLDEYLRRCGDSLSLEDRLELVRQLADVLRYAHQRRLVHRGLTPAQVYVNTEATPPRVVVRDWQTGRRSAGSTSQTTSAPPTATSFGTADVRALIVPGDWIYLAPETHQGAPDLPSVPLDVYGLGALSYLILTGQPPAATIAELQSRLESNGCLDPQVAETSLPDVVADLVRHATARAESDRTVTVDAFLHELDDVYDQLTAPPDPSTPAPERHQAKDPLTAVPGDAIAERFIVRERRGSGSTGTALLVDDVDDDRLGVVLKIAKDDSARRRLDDEAEVLAQLDHPRLVRLLEPPLDVDDRRALLLSDAGKQTLAGWLETNGRATIAELERFGSDLMEAVAFLDSKGVFHRDIKPANLGILPDPGNRRPRLVLFDFSLARESLTNLGSGTRGYVDPFIALSTAPVRKGVARIPARRQFDRAAELYAVAVTLFEMATTQQPWWRDGGEAGPESMQDPPVIAPEMFEPAVAGGLAAFFARALAGDVGERFGDVPTMARAWHAVFAKVEAQDHDAHDAADRDAAAAAATLDTPLNEAGLSSRALSALSRLQATTVGELVRTPPLRINSVPGLGEQYRKEVQRRVREWRRSLLPSADTDTQPAAPLVGDRSVEAYLRRLLPRAADSDDTPVLRALLGYTDDASATSIATAGSTTRADARSKAEGPDSEWWPSAGHVAAVVGSSRSAVIDVIDAAGKRWRRSDVVKVVRDELVDALRAEEGVATLPELAASLVLRHGSTAEGPERLRRAAGLVRAAVEADAGAAEPSFAVRRQAHGPVLIAAIPGATDDGDPAAQLQLGEAMLQDAEALGHAAGQLVEQQNILSAASARESLRRLELNALQLSDDRLLRLAAAASGSASLSSFHELHRLDLPPATMAEVALRGVTSARVSPAGVARRVANRFPALPPLPDRPRLDELVTAALPGMRWDGEQYSRPTTGASSALSSSTRSSTHMNRLAGEPLDALDRHLRSSLRLSSALTLCVGPRHHDDAVRVLHQTYGVQPVDIAAMLLKATRATAERDDVSWQLVLQSDVQRQGGDWSHLCDLVRDAVAQPWAEVLADQRPLLLTNAAPLARYGLSDLLSSLLDQSQPRPAARWLLVPRRSAQGVPTLDGRPVPLGPSKWLDLPADLTSLASHLDSPSGVPA
jgi:serine/threonine protein kinase